ncbi:exostosin family protein [Tumidithrix elongata RA019]|uniref:Exostosin family protein n=1 Tax=Tumidithrix elongata BACA0141 TaxID=2716417 RepID=A0AAW9PZK6_9CYAN|nr:exostosin family protein [Tumidithrix elongata RA019]
MKIYVSPCNPMMMYRIDQLYDWAKLAQPQIHTFTEDPEEADIIFVPDTLFTYHHNRQFLYKFLHKCYALDCADRPHLIIPGLYASAIKFFHKHRVRGCSYLFNRHRRNAFLNSEPEVSDRNSSGLNNQKQYLFSFIGGSTSWVRKRLLKLNFQRDDVVVRCSTGTYNHWSDEQQNREAIQKSYVEVIRQSKFALCPRGIGSNSIRLFEVMELGVAPIIISDVWLPPSGPDWQSFALFVKESAIDNLVAIAERHISESEERGRLAREAWEQYFSDPFCFNRCIEVIEELSQSRIPVLDKVILYCYPLVIFGIQCKELVREWLRVSILFVFRVFSLKFPYEVERD